MYITIFLGSYFTGLGLISNEMNNSKYLLSYIIFFLAMTIPLLLIIKRTSNKYNETYSYMFERWLIIFKLLGIISLFAQFSKLVYPEFRILELFEVKEYIFNPEIFSIRSFRAEDSIYQTLNNLRSLTYPFFFVWLYTLRKKPYIFVFLIFFYQYIEYVNDGYYSRSNLAVYIFFLLFYFYEEKIFDKRILNISTILIIIIAIPVFTILSYIRTGKEISFNITEYFDFFEILMVQESFSLKYLDVMNSFSSQLSFIEMLLRWITLPLPIIPNIDFPILSYAYTNAMIGISSDQAGYYILLPGAFGEGLMMLGMWGVWIYGAFIGVFVGVVFNILKKVPYLKYWLLYFMIDYARAFRGGIQTFIEATYNTSLLLIVIGLFFLWHNKTKSKNSYKNNEADFKLLRK